MSMSTRRGLRSDDLTQGGPTMMTTMIMTTNIGVLGHDSFLKINK